MAYFLIGTNEDGEVFVEQFNETAPLLQTIKEEKYREADFIQKGEEILIDPQYWEGKVLLIKGEIVIPKPVKVVTEFEI